MRTKFTFAGKFIQRFLDVRRIAKGLSSKCVLTYPSDTTSYKDWKLKVVQGKLSEPSLWKTTTTTKTLLWSLGLRQANK